MTKHSENTKTATCDNNVLANRLLIFGIMKTSGFKEYRLKKDDKYYAKEIKALQVFNQDHLEHADLIVFGQKTGTCMEANDTLSDREEKIVLGVIQWLGTPVGQGFISAFNHDVE
jgi:hypothetical protein